MSFEIANVYILKYFYYIFIALLFAYMVLGRKTKDLTKRIPLFFLALLFFIVMISAVLTKQKNLPAYLPSVLFVLLFGSSFGFFRDRFFPYRLKCAKCGKKLTLKDIFIDEGYLCTDCKGESKEESGESEDDSDPEIPENGDE